MAAKDNHHLLPKNFDVKKMHKEFRQDTQSYNIRFSQFEIKINKKYMKIYSKKKNTAKIVQDLSLNHTITYHVTDSSTPGIDSCRVLADPFGLESVFVFNSPQFASDYENHIIKGKKDFISHCCNFVFKAYVENATEESKPSASMTISGMSTGKEIKLWIEKEFNLPQIHDENYVLGIILNDKFRILGDHVSAFILYDHLESNGTTESCTIGCFKDPKTIVIEEIYLQIRMKNNISEKSVNKKFYSIEKYCPDHFLPKWLLRLLSDLYYKGPFEQGVFRVNGKESILPKWYSYMLKYDDFVIEEDTINKAAVLKCFLRNIAGSLMSQIAQKPIESICRKLLSKGVTAEKYISEEKNKAKLFGIIRSLPRTHYYILQHILVVFEAILTYGIHGITPICLARSISPSIFPLLDLNLWEIATTLLEAIILLSKDIVQDFARDKILKDFASFHVSDSTSSQSEDISIVSSEQNNSKQLKLNSGEIICDDLSLTTVTSIVDQDLLNVEINHPDCINKESSLNSGSLFNSSKISSFKEFLIKEDTAQQLCSSPNKFNEMHQNKSRLESLENSADNCKDSYSNKSYESDMDKYQLETSESFPSNSYLSKNICMGIKMKKILNDRKNPIDFDLSSDIEFKENISTSTERDKISKNQRHKSVIKPETFAKDISRKASTVILTPGCHSLRNSNDSVDFATSRSEVTRRASRKTSSELHPANDNLSDHRSRSPPKSVKNLVQVYENKCKSISSQSSQQ